MPCSGIGKLDPVTITLLPAGVMLRLVCRACPGTRQEEGGLLIRISVFFLATVIRGSQQCVVTSGMWNNQWCSCQWVYFFFNLFHWSMVDLQCAKFFLWPCHGACGTLVSHHGSKPPHPPPQRKRRVPATLCTGTYNIIAKGWFPVSLRGTTWASSKWVLLAPTGWLPSSSPINGFLVNFVLTQARSFLLVSPGL